MNAQAIGRIAFEQRTNATPDITIARHLRAEGITGGMPNPEWRKCWGIAAAEYCRLFRSVVQEASDQCRTCGGPLEGRDRRVMYCSDECKQKGRTPEAPCGHCGKAFKGRPGAAYCSRSCSQRARRNREMVPCPCGARFRVKPSQRDRYSRCLRCRRTTGERREAA